jgi:hypothetical protein
MTYVLSNNQMVRVPPGADPDYVRHIKENELKIATKPKPQTPPLNLRQPQPVPAVNRDRLRSTASGGDGGVSKESE